MVIAMLDVHIKQNRIDDFKTWVAESNKIISKFEGFVSRRLLASSDGTLKMMVEFNTPEQFAAMRQSPEHQTVHQQAIELLDVPPSPTIYHVASE